MAGTFNYLRYHIVWSTRNRQRLLDEQMQHRLFDYLGSVIAHKDGMLLKAGGTEDHVHVSVSLSTTLCVADAVNALKANSSRWLRRDVGIEDFAWQEGYGAFTVSRSGEDQLNAYILGQKAHHANRDFKEEFRMLLDKHGIEFDEKLIWL